MTLNSKTNMRGLSDAAMLVRCVVARFATLIRRCSLRTPLGWFGWMALVFLALVEVGHAAETVTYYYTDQQGTVLATADAAGNILGSTDYRPYGALARGTQGEGPGFAGHIGDVDTGLDYMLARYYDPASGRFLSVDPAALRAADTLRFGRFTYAVNNPIGRADPDGKQDEDGEQIEEETREAMARLRPPLGPNMAAPGYVPPPTMAPGMLPETFPEHMVAQSLGLEPVPTVGENLPTAEPEATRTYQVYIKVNASTGEIYTGRTSGFEDPRDNVARRDASHHMNEKGFGPAILMYSSANRDAIRGQEQIMIENYGGARRAGGSSGNEINGISPRNSKLQQYIDAAQYEFGR